MPILKSSEDLRQRGEFALVLLLLLINALNLADLAFTFMALRAGYREANPFMAGMFASLTPFAAGLIKLAIGASFTVVAWVLRDRKGMTVIVAAVLCVYFVLYIFHIYVTLQVV